MQQRFNLGEKAWSYVVDEVYDGGSVEILCAEIIGIRLEGAADHRHILYSLRDLGEFDQLFRTKKEAKEACRKYIIELRDKQIKQLEAL